MKRKVPLQQEVATYMAREQCIELNHAVGIGLGDAAEECIVQVGSVIVIAIALRLNACVDTSCIRVPDICPDSGQRLAGRYVDELDVRGDRNTLLVVNQVGAHVLAKDVERSHLSLGVEDGTGGFVEHVLFSMVSE